LFIANITFTIEEWATVELVGLMAEPILVILNCRGDIPLVNDINYSFFVLIMVTLPSFNNDARGVQIGCRDQVDLRGYRQYTKQLLD
jgi:hypothetical protein